MGDVIAWLGMNGLELLGAITALAVALLGIAVLIPGDIPDKWLQSMVDILKKISNQGSKKD